jgi:hypothetical protein
MHDEGVYDDQAHDPPGSSPEVVYGRVFHGLDYTGEQCTVPKLKSDRDNLHQYLFYTISLFDSGRIHLFFPFRIETACCGVAACHGRRNEGRLIEQGVDAQL